MVLFRQIGELAEPEGFIRLPHAGGLAEQHLVQDAAQAVHVGPGVEITLARRLFGAHVSRGAEGQASLSDVCTAGRAYGPRDAKVRDHGMAFGEQDVLRLDVAVQDALPMGVAQRVSDILHDAEGRRRVDGFLAEKARSQRFAVDERHDEVQEPGSLSRIMERDDVWVRQASGDLDFLEEPFRA